MMMALGLGVKIMQVVAGGSSGGREVPREGFSDGVTLETGKMPGALEGRRRLWSRDRKVRGAGGPGSWGEGRQLGRSQARALGSIRV